MIRQHASRIAGALMAAAALAAPVAVLAAPEESEDYSTWADSRDIIINTSGNGANISENVANFPVLIRLGATESSILDAADEGRSIRFSKADGITPLPYEIEHWSPTAAAIWVKVDTVYGNNATQKILMHWGNASAVSQSNGHAVFDTANGYVGAWHLGNASGTDPRPGSVAGSPAAIVRNGLPPVAGIIGMADTLGNIPGVDPANGGNPLAGRYIDFGRDADFNDNNYEGFSDFTTGFSFSVWVNATSTAAYTRFIVLGSDSSATNEVGHSSRIMFMGNQNQSGTQPNFAVRSNGVGNYNSPENAYSFNTWTQIFVTKAPGASTAYNIYKNGDLLASSGNGSAPQNVMRNYAWMGRSSAHTDGWFGGRFDNVTLAKTARSADFVRLSYQNQKAVNAVVNIGPYEYAATVPGTPTAVTATAANGEAMISWTAPGNNGGSAITGYTVKSSPENLTCTGTTTSCTVTGLTNGVEYTFTVAAINAIDTGSFSLASNSVIPTAFAGWASGRSITLNTSATGANIPGDVHNFPVLIRLGADEATILSAAKAGGADIRFLAEDSATVIPHEIESWSATAAAIWVNVDVVKGNNATQKIHMLWGNPDAESASNGPAVFDSANGYRAVWHMGGDAEEVNAVGIDTLNAAVTGDVPTKDGLIGKARSYANDIANYLSVPGSASGLLNFAPETDYSLSAWLYSEEVTPANLGILNKGNDQWLIGVYGGAEDKFYDIMTRGNGSWNQASTEAGDNTVTTADAIGVWRHVMGVWQGSGTPQDTGRIYINGNLVNTTFFDDITEGSDGRDTTTDVYIGVLWENGGLARPFFGLLDEVTASHTFRDSNWVKLTYESQKLTQKLTNIGVTEPGPATAPSAPRSVTAAVGGTQGTVTVTWVAPANNGGAEITGYAVTGTPSGSCTPAAGALTCNVTGLTPGEYSFTVTATNSAGTSDPSTAATVTVPVGLALPDAFAIHMDGARTPYTYRLPTGMIALTEMFSMTITDVQGKQVWTRTINPASNKVGEITWNGTTLKGQPVAPGMYIVRLRAQMDGKTIEAVRGSIRK